MPPNQVGVLKKDLSVLLTVDHCPVDHAYMSILTKLLLVPSVIG